MPLEQLEAEALRLSARDRAQLAHRLIASLEGEERGEGNAAEMERAWEEETRRRLDEYRSGAVQAVPASEVFARARARLR
jgi:putative addiction module component (TIGR02574 family)